MGPVDMATRCSCRRATFGARACGNLHAAKEGGNTCVVFGVDAATFESQVSTVYERYLGSLVSDDEEDTYAAMEQVGDLDRRELMRIRKLSTALQQRNVARATRRRTRRGSTALAATRARAARLRNAWTLSVAQRSSPAALAPNLLR